MEETRYETAERCPKKGLNVVEITELSLEEVQRIAERLGK